MGVIWGTRRGAGAGRALLTSVASEAWGAGGVANGGPVSGGVLVHGPVPCMMYRLHASMAARHPSINRAARADFDAALLEVARTKAISGLPRPAVVAPRTAWSIGSKFIIASKAVALAMRIDSLATLVGCFCQLWPFWGQFGRHHDLRRSTGSDR